MKQEEEYEQAKAEQGTPAGGYLIGRHPECGKFRIEQIILMVHSI